MDNRWHWQHIQIPKMMKLTFKHTTIVKKSHRKRTTLLQQEHPPPQNKTRRVYPNKHLPEMLQAWGLFHLSMPRRQELQSLLECGEHDHTWRDCKNITKKCLNCNGSHSTLANKCPKRKLIRNKKLQDRKTQTSQTYSQATAKTTNTTHPHPSNLNNLLHTDTHYCKNSYLYASRTCA